MTEASMMQQQIRLGLRLNALSGTPAGTTNTGVMTWSTPAVAANPTSRFADTAWVTLASTAAAGTSFKFLRKGIYRFDVCVPLVASEVTATMIAGTLDAVSLLAAGVNIATPALYEDYAYGVQIVDLQISLKLHFTVHITNTLRSSGTYATTAPVGTSAVGTARIHIGDGAGGAVAAQGVDVEAATLRLNDLAELFG